MLRVYRGGRRSRHRQWVSNTLVRAFRRRRVQHHVMCETQLRRRDPAAAGSMARIPEAQAPAQLTQCLQFGYVQGRFRR
jgi:hypothetical protein